MNKNRKLLIYRKDTGGCNSTFIYDSDTLILRNVQIMENDLSHKCSLNPILELILLRTISCSTFILIHNSSVHSTFLSPTIHLFLSLRSIPLLYFISFPILASFLSCCLYAYLFSHHFLPTPSLPVLFHLIYR